MTSDQSHQDRPRRQRLACSVVAALIATGAVVSAPVSDANARQPVPAAAPIEIGPYPGAPFEDRQGNLWFGTVGEGVVRYDGRTFTNFTTKDGLGSDTLRAMIEDDDGVLWFATTGGLTRHDGETFTTLTDYDIKEARPGLGPHGQHRDLWDVMIDSQGVLWIATMDGAFRLEDDRFVRFPLPVVAPEDAFEFSPRMVYAIYEDKDGRLWFGTDGAGAIRYDGESMRTFTAQGDGLCSDNVATILQDARGNFWFGTANGGVSHYDGETFTTHLRAEEHSIHHGHGRYLAIHEDRSGDIWFGAAYARGGVYRHDGETFEHFGAEHGLDGGVPSILEDRNGTVWFGTTEGVYHFDGRNFIRFTRNDPRLPPSLDGWIPETLTLPPGFAPDLPKGVETLLFAPGWRDPASEEYWSYAFVMSIDEAAPDADGVRDLLTAYYTGLMSAFGVGRDEDVGDHVEVTVTERKPGRYDVTMRLIDGFATFKPITVHAHVESVAIDDTHAIVRIQVSSQPEGHAIWRSLDAAIAHIQRDDDAPTSRQE